jgi:hypothetical protein
MAGLFAVRQSKTILARSCESGTQSTEMPAHREFHLVEDTFGCELNGNLKCRYASRFETPPPKEAERSATLQRFNDQKIELYG